MNKIELKYVMQKVWRYFFSLDEFARLVNPLTNEFTLEGEAALARYVAKKNEQKGANNEKCI